MKRVLIIAYHFPPLNVVASKRTKAYADYLQQFGIRPTIFTPMRTSNGHLVEENVSIQKGIYDTHDEILVPIPFKTKAKILSFLLNIPLLDKLVITFHWMIGNLNVSPAELNSYINLKKALNNYLKSEQFDAVIGIYSPHHCLKLAHFVYKKFNLPYILDFRDLWAKHVFTHSVTVGNSQKFQDKFIKYYWKRWIKSSASFSITSPEWLSILETLTSKKGHIIPNGFDDKLLTISSSKSEYFSVGCIGTFYPNQDLGTFLTGFKHFLKSLPSSERENVKLEFLGLNKTYRPNLIDEIKSYVPENNIQFLPKTDQLGVIKFCQSQTLIWHPAFPDSSGWFSAKIYDYLAAKTAILFCPSDRGIVEKTLIHMEHISFVNKIDMVVSYLQNKYRLWKNGEIDQMKDSQLHELQSFTRSNQAQKMGKIILPMN
ncbi:hypothetical protein [Marinoscillum pacificum]|uniref:hypothetical protein n=1 Tax=Marinoscillum pacificum TaxID=392723 RepID=UPI002157D0F2|nr:hypothetical protein [Marinoscillum pacificum]